MSGPTTDYGEHTIADDILISGEEIRGYSAGEELTRGEPVEITDNYEVSAAVESFAGVALYSVAEGEDLALAGDDCEVRLEVSEAVEAGDALAVDGNGGFEVAVDADDAVAVANEGGGTGDWIEAYLTSTSGNLGEV